MGAASISRGGERVVGQIFFDVGDQDLRQHGQVGALGFRSSAGIGVRW
ncbi:MAG: hypothetical protein R2873_09535 [Caldilineaceae bacterium]